MGEPGGRRKALLTKRVSAFPPEKTPPAVFRRGGSEEGIGQLFSSLRALTLCQNGVVSSLVTAK